MWVAMILTVALLEAMSLSSLEPGKVLFLLAHQRINSSYSALNASTTGRAGFERDDMTWVICIDSYHKAMYHRHCPSLSVGCCGQPHSASPVFPSRTPRRPRHVLLSGEAQ